MSFSLIIDKFYTAFLLIRCLQILHFFSTKDARSQRFFNVMVLDASVGSGLAQTSCKL